MFDIHTNKSEKLINLLKYLKETTFEKCIKLLKSLAYKSEPEPEPEPEPKSEPELFDVFTYDYDKYTNIKTNMKTIISYIKDNLFIDLYWVISIIKDIDADNDADNVALYNNILKLLSNLEKYEKDDVKDEELKKNIISHLIWYINLILNINLLLYYNAKYSDIIRNIEYNNIFYAILNYLMNNNSENEIPFSLKKKDKNLSLNKLTNKAFDKYIFDQNFILKIEIIKLKTKKEGDNPENFTNNIAEIKNDIKKKLFNELKEDFIQNEEIITKAKTNITLLKNYEKHKSNQITTGGENKFKSTKNKITVIYKKKQYTRVIYISERKKYVKINKTYFLLSKLKKV